MLTLFDIIKLCSKGGINGPRSGETNLVCSKEVMDIKNLTEMVKKIYKEHYWDRIK